MKKSLTILKVFTLTLVLVLTVSLVNAANRYSVANGNWNATTTWSATAGGASGATIPVAGDVVYIVGGFNVNIPAGYTAVCTTLNITIGTTAGTGTLTFAASSTLNVSGNVTVGTAGSGSREGTIDMTAGGTLNCGGNLTIGNDGAVIPIASQINQGSGSLVNVTGNVSIIAPGNNNYSNQWAVNDGQAFITGSLTLANTGGNTNDCNFIISTGTATINGAVTMNGATAENSLTLTGAGVLNLGSTISPTNGTFGLAVGSLVNYTAAAQTLRVATYSNLTLSGSGNKTVSGITVDGTLSMQGTAAATGTPVTYGANAILEYKGSANQTTTNVEFPAAMSADLIINNASGVILNGAKTLSASLTLTNGILTTTATNLLTIPDNFSTVNGGSNASYVNGPLRKNGNDAFTFPVGKAGLYSPISITAPDNNNDAFSAEYIRASATALGPTGPGLFRVSNCEYWNLNELNDAGAANSINVTIGWFPGSGCGGSGYVTDLTGIVVAHFNGATWDTWAGSTSGNPTTGTVIRTAVNTFSPFTIGSTVDNGNPLPVRFSDVRAFEKVAGVQIEWTNQTETNIVNYVVERSANGRDFTPINQLAARGNMGDKESYMSIDATPITGANFYRIKATEFDGKTIYSKLLKVVIGEKQTGLVLYPNPVRGNELTIGYTAAKGQYTLQVVNAIGQQVMSQQINHPGGTISQAITLPGNVKTGMYNLLISGDNYKQTKMFIVQ